MSADRKSHWEKAWSGKRMQDKSWHQELPSPSLSMIDNAGTHPGEAVIDVGGGASPLPACLLEKGFSDITVLDISAAAIRSAQALLGERGEGIHWIEADITRARLERRYALWHDRAALHFLTRADDQARYVDVLNGAVLPGGQAIIATFAPGGPRKCSGLDIVQYDAELLATVLGPGWTLAEQSQENHLTPAGGQQKFGFYRFSRAEQGA